MTRLDRGEVTVARVRTMIARPERDPTPHEIADALTDTQREAMTTGLVRTRFAAYATHVRESAVRELGADYPVAQMWHDPTPFKSRGLWHLGLNKIGLRVAAILAAQEKAP